VSLHSSLIRVLDYRSTPSQIGFTIETAGVLYRSKRLPVAGQNV
jgi:hypothetical protein